MKYIASCSFGKDSIATVLLALEHREPLDFVLFCEVMFDNKRNISGEDPEHIKWIYDKAIPFFEQMGVPTKVLRSEQDYVSLFYKVRGSGKYKGMYSGFPIVRRCSVNRDCKVGVIKKYLRTLGEEYTQYIGIAIDEPKRLARLKDNAISLLAKYGYTERMAMELCRKYDLVSPIYENGSRGGCWFCPNMKIASASVFRDKHPDLWRELDILAQEPNRAPTLFSWGLTFQQYNEKIDRYNATQDIAKTQLTFNDF